IYYARHYGIRASLTLFVARLAFWSTPRDRRPAAFATRAVNLPNYRYPIHFRLLTSDVFAIDQIFGREEYGAARRLTQPGVIVDCGANIGCTAVYFLNL